MAGFLRLRGDRRGNWKRVAMPTVAAEAAFARALDGRRFDDPGPKEDWNILRRISAMDPSDTPDD